MLPIGPCGKWQNLALPNGLLQPRGDCAKEPSPQDTLKARVAADVRARSAVGCRRSRVLGGATLC